MTRVVVIMIRFRFWLSARWPVGKVNRIIGAICARPTNPNASAECVRSYSSQPTATVSICWPKAAMKRELKKRRKSRFRSTAYGLSSVSAVCVALDIASK